MHNNEIILAGSFFLLTLSIWKYHHVKRRKIVIDDFRSLFFSLHRKAKTTSESSEYLMDALGHPILQRETLAYSYHTELGLDECLLCIDKALKKKGIQIHHTKLDKNEVTGTISFLGMKIYLCLESETERNAYQTSGSRRVLIFIK